MNGSIMDADAVAELIGMGRDWVYAEARADRIPHVRVGRKVRFRRESIDAWLAEIERGPVMSSGSKPDANQGGERC